MNFFLRHLRVNRSGTLIMLGIQGGLFLFGVFLVVFINASINADRDYAAIGSMMALIGSIFGGMARGGVGAQTRYRMAISMGSTRLSYLIADPILTAMNCVIGVAAAWVLNKAETALYAALYPGWALDFDLLPFFRSWWPTVVLVLGMCFLDFCAGGIQLRFGMKAFGIAWFALCFSPTIFGLAATAVETGSDSLLGQFGRAVLAAAGLLPPMAWGFIAGLLAVALVVLSARWYWRAEVRM